MNGPHPPGTGTASHTAKAFAIGIADGDAMTTAGGADIDKQEFNLVPLDLKTFIDFYVFLLGIRLFTDFTLLHQP